MYIDLHVNYPLFSDIKEPCIFSTEFRKILKYEISGKFNCQWEPSCSMRMDGRTGGQTDTMKSIITFRNNANQPKNY